MLCSTWFYCCECADGPQNAKLSPACTSCNHRVCSSCSCETERIPVTAGENIVPVKTLLQKKRQRDSILPSDVPNTHCQTCTVYPCLLDEDKWYRYCCKCGDGPQLTKFDGAACVCGHDWYLNPPFLKEDEERPKTPSSGSSRQKPSQPSHRNDTQPDQFLSISSPLSGKYQDELVPLPLRASRRQHESLDDDDEGAYSIRESYHNFGQDGDSTRAASPSGTTISISTRTTYCERSDSEDSDIEILSDSETDHDCSTCAGSPIDVENSHWSERIVSPMTRHIVDRIMNGLHFAFDLKSGIITCTADGSASSSSPCSSSNSGQGNSAGRSSNAGSKRSQDDGDSLPPGDDGDNDRGKRPKRNPTSPNGEYNHSRKYACPYFKRNPQKYKRWRSCSGPGWDYTGRVKEHLYRRHALPQHQCARCYSTFKDASALIEHQRQQPPCDVREGELMEGIDLEKENKLRSKKGINSQSGIERWNAIYRIVFPDDDFSEIPSPFYDENNLQTSTSHPGHFEAYCRRELPRQIRARLEIIVEKEAQQLGQVLKSQIEPTVRSSWDAVISSFQQEHRHDTGHPAEALRTDNSAAYAGAVDSVATPSSQGEPSLLSASFVAPTLNIRGVQGFQVTVPEYEQYAPALERRFNRSIGLPFGSMNPPPKGFYPDDLDAMVQPSPVGYQGCEVPQDMLGFQSLNNEPPSTYAGQANTDGTHRISASSFREPAPWSWVDDEVMVGQNQVFEDDPHAHLSAAFPDIRTTSDAAHQTVDGESTDDQNLVNYSDVEGVLEDDLNRALGGIHECRW